MLARSAAAAAAAKQQNLALRRLLSSTALPVLSSCHTSLPATTPALRRHITSDQNPRPLRRKSFRSLAGLQRQVTTSVEEYLPSGHMEAVSKALYELRPVDPTEALVITDRSRHFPSRLPGRRSYRAALPETLQESLCVFDACIQVGRLERAVEVLKRMLGAVSPAEEIELHDRFLEARLLQMQHEGRDADPGDDLHKWFEVHIRSRGIPHTHDTIALLIKASLIGSPRHLELRVKRYMSMLDKETALETLYIDGLLDPEELTAIGRICPEYNSQAEQVGALRDQSGAEDGEGSHLRTDESDPRPIPHVLVTPQKGVGLKVLRQTLAVFDEIPQGGEIHSLSDSVRKEIQIRLEQDCVDGAIHRWREENQTLLDMGLNTSLNKRPLATRLYEWHKALEARLVEEMKLIDISEAMPAKKGKDWERCQYGPFLRLCPPSRLAAATILSTLSALSMVGIDRGVPLSNVVNQIAQTVEEEIRMQHVKDAMGKDGHVPAKRALRTTRRVRYSGGIPKGTSEDDDLPGAKPWTTPIRMQVGCALYQALMETAKIEVVREHPETKALVSQIQPAFTHTLQLKKGKRVGVVVANQELVNVLKSEPHQDHLARLLPMVVEPAPWTKFDKGGYLTTPTSLIRLKNGEIDQKIYSEAAMARGDMEQVLRGLDVLGKTAWKINKAMLHVMLEAWNQGDAIANIPALHPQLNIPPEPEACDEPEERAKWLRAVKAAENTRAGLHSERCHMNLQLEIARAFRDQVFYFPHNIDFRGRAYPIPAYLNHMGADHVRGLLMFAKGKALGTRGLAWLKVQLANVYGFDKASLSERENFASENLDNIRDSAANPLTGKRWWLQAEDPWQCLAACIELAAAMELPDPTQYISHLPVHQDGTCNGLQHYAALGGDTWGAQQVNLVPGDRPSDVYSAVAREVEALIAKDAEAGVEMAKAIRGKVTRKVVKQTVMTNVYGVTMVGAKRQVDKQIRDIHPDLPGLVGHESYFIASYITRKIFASLQDMFSGAHEIQKWLGQISARVCKSVSPEQIQELLASRENPFTEDGVKGLETDRNRRGATAFRDPFEDVHVVSLFRSSVVWTTPLRMPVAQPYRHAGSTTIKTCLQDLTIITPEANDPVNKRKQLQAFPPNFIHSLDASHMLLSALECDALGLSFAAVHDSFWTHACDVDDMSKVLRDAFVRIHSEDVIGRLRAEFQARYKGHYYLGKIKLDTAIAQKITELRREKWSRASRPPLTLELAWEMERQRLLQSSDPAEVQRGREIVTPTSLYEAYADECDVVSEYDNFTDVYTDSDMKLLNQENQDPEDPEDQEDQEQEQRDDEDDCEPSVRESIPEMEARKEKEISANIKHDFTMTLLKKGVSNQVHYTDLWLPLTFPDIPKKGDFDVSTLKNSKYFFS